jgi:hypothetical protein
MMKTGKKAALPYPTPRRGAKHFKAFETDRLEIANDFSA